jgi:outer membrane lipoprotein LolB
MTGTRALALACTLLVAACATSPFDRAPATPAGPFDLSARVAVRYDGQAFSSGLRWRHAAGRDEIWLVSPAGQALAHLVDDGDGALLTSADKRQHRAASVEALTRQALGWELPVAHLKHWLRGTPVPGITAQALERDTAQRIVRLEQAGWRIVLGYAPPQDGKDGNELPRRLDLSRGAHEIRLVIDAWRDEAAP